MTRISSTVFFILILVSVSKNIMCDNKVSFWYKNMTYLEITTIFPLQGDKFMLLHNPLNREIWPIIWHWHFSDGCFGIDGVAHFLPLTLVKSLQLYHDCIFCWHHYEHLTQTLKHTEQSTSQVMQNADVGAGANWMYCTAMSASCD